MTVPQIVVEMYDAIRTVGVPSGSTSAAELLKASYTATSFSQLARIELQTSDRATGHLLAICDEMKRTGEFPRVDCIDKAIQTEELRLPATSDLLVGSADPDGIACQLIRLIPNNGSPETYELLNSHGLLRSAYALGAENVVGALLEHLPVLELDGDMLPKQDPPAGRSQSAIKRLIDAARELTRVYRRDRSLLLRRILRGSLQFDVFDLIDAYGAGTWHDTAIDMTIDSDDESVTRSRYYSRAYYRASADVHDTPSPAPIDYEVTLLQQSILSREC